MIRQLTNKQRAYVFKDTIYSKIKKSMVKKKTEWYFIAIHTYREGKIFWNIF